MWSSAAAAGCRCSCYVHLVFADLRSQGLSDKTPPETWTLERMAADLSELAAAMGYERYATLGNSYGAFVVLQHAVDHAGGPAATSVTRPAGASTSSWSAPRAPSSRPTCCGTSRPRPNGSTDVEDRLGDVTHPVLVLAGRHDRACVAEAIAAGVPGARLAVFEASGHFPYAEENEAYLGAVRRFLQSVP